MSLARLRHLVSKILAISWRERRDLVYAQLELLRAWTRVRLMPRGRLIHRASPAAEGDGDVERLEELATAVERAADHGLFSPTCLVRAVALERMIDRLPPAARGRAVVRVGVRPDGRALLAHAWIVVGDRVVGDSARKVARFVPLQDFTALDA